MVTMVNTRLWERVRSTIALYKNQRTDSIARGHGATDGTSDEMDFASRIRTAKHGPHHNVALNDAHTGTSSVAAPVAPSHPGYDGHHSQVPSDGSYRSGPSVESGPS